ncbi:helix-turn-helix domain-containing protein [Streptococcus cristatus]|uniref:helix-turn-helix domain-containing protein n=1 Tax=Streptococcus cristatus TaxID=45634 RepID=UPI000F67C338|nr:helix-turn-helix transcriptional regulator [Streptococcus cristatus]RSJ71224.1 anaerobic benzoate catabolism transcriptional regulator [Streptococcus cristatus]
MSELKIAIGKKIRELREQRKMTRELLCEDETRLTVRQLARIEAGDSIPSLLTLEFIAQQLRIEMYQIIKESTKS